MFVAPPYSSSFRDSRGFFAIPLAFLLAGSLALATDVSTYHNDSARTGRNLKETILTPTNVNSASFGLLFSAAVDGVIDAQPLYLASVHIPGQGTHNVLYAVTENDSAYAFDADTGAQLWRTTVRKSSEIPSDTRNCAQITPEIGVTSTPVIDRSAGVNGILFLVAMSKDSAGNYYQRLHALDLATGAERKGGPVTISARYPGTGEGSSGGFVSFDAVQYAERAGLLLLNGVVYTAWTSHCDADPYTGWIIGYQETSLQRSAILNVTPNGSEGAIWQAGDGLAADSLGNIFLLDANGTFDTTLDSRGFPIHGDFGNGMLKISTTGANLEVADYFNAYDTVSESDSDTDLGSGGVILIPPLKDSSGKSWNLAIGAGKDGNIYVADRKNMGKFSPLNDNAIYQELDGVLPGGVWSAPAYFDGNVYFGPVNASLLQFRFANAKLGATPVSQSAITFTYPGTSPSISANGTANGILWAIEHTSSSVLHAYDPSNLAVEYYNSNEASGGRDQFGCASHFGTPTVANGKVYVGTSNGVAVFGLLANK